MYLIWLVLKVAEWNWDESYARIDQTVDEIKSVFEPQADQKGLNLIFETQVEHQHVLCDITKTKQILVNLISNAVKYTPAGGNRYGRCTGVFHVNRRIL